MILPHALQLLQKSRPANPLFDRSGISKGGIGSDDRTRHHRLYIPFRHRLKMIRYKLANFGVEPVAIFLQN